MILTLEQREESLSRVLRRLAAELGRAHQHGLELGAHLVGLAGRSVQYRAEQHLELAETTSHLLLARLLGGERCAETECGVAHLQLQLERSAALAGAGGGALTEQRVPAGEDELALALDAIAVPLTPVGDAVGPQQEPGAAALVTLPAAVEARAVREAHHAKAVAPAPLELIHVAHVVGAQATVLPCDLVPATALAVQQCAGQIQTGPVLLEPRPHRHSIAELHLAVATHPVASPLPVVAQELDR
mmetsp:Transcript_16564/g.49587  ORF Transcript_16564/g.49587 Transcript_16564/m.49587 type:complete len:245 (+) Transcript_16564:910-1644(+)